MSAPFPSILFRRRLVVERFAFVDDVHRQQLHGLVADDLESSVRGIPNIYGSYAGWKWDLLAIWQFNSAPFLDVK